MKRILFLTYENPFTRFSGDSIYTANILDAMRELGLSIDILYYNSNRIQPEIPTLEAKTFRLTKSVEFFRIPKWTLIFSHLPGMIASRRKKSYLRQVQGLINDFEYDGVFINHFRMSFVIDVVPKDYKTIYISHNSEYKLSLNNASQEYRLVHKAVYLWDAIRTYFYEKKVIQAIDSFTAICEYDLNALHSYKTVSSCILRPVLSPGNDFVDFEKFKLELKNLIVVGSYTWGPKAQNIIRLVKEFKRASMSTKGFRLLIVGRIEETLMQKLTEIEPKVEVSGLVDDIEKYYNEASIAIIPEAMGGGFKLKVAEAALRCKAIVSIKGAINACNLKVNAHYLEFENLSLMFQGIESNIKNPELMWGIANDAMSVIQKDNTIKNLKSNLAKLME